MVKPIRIAKVLFPILQKVKQILIDQLGESSGAREEGMLIAIAVAIQMARQEKFSQKDFLEFCVSTWKGAEFGDQLAEQGVTTIWT